MKKLELTTPEQWEKTLISEDELRDALKITEDKLENMKGMTFYPWPIITIPADWNKSLRNAVAMRYKDFGWNKVVHYVSDEYGENSKITTIILFTEERFNQWKENNRYAQKFDYTVI